MINNPEGKNYLNRDGAMDVMDYKIKDIYQSIIKLLSRLGWSNGDQEIFSMEEMLDLFDYQILINQASSYNAEKIMVK